MLLLFNKLLAAKSFLNVLSPHLLIYYIKMEGRHPSYVSKRFYVSPCCDIYCFTRKVTCSRNNIISKFYRQCFHCFLYIDDRLRKMLSKKYTLLQKYKYTYIFYTSIALYDLGHVKMCRKISSCLT